MIKLQLFTCTSEIICFCLKGSKCSKVKIEDITEHTIISVSGCSIERLITFDSSFFCCPPFLVRLNVLMVSICGNMK